MIRFFYLAVVTALLLAACKKSKKNEPTVPEPPAALQEGGGASYEIISKGRYDDDLVKSIYEELVEKNPALKNFEKELRSLDEHRRDSTKSYVNFDGKNTSYYGSAGGYISTISDSVLRMRMMKIIDSSTSNYNKQMAGHKNLLDRLHAKDTILSDLHVVIKIIHTLEVVEKYQKENAPSKTPLENINGRLDKMITTADTLSRLQYRN